MNERIRELFQQSSTEAFDHTVIGSNPRDYVCIYNKVFDPEKFAELIVKECAEISKNYAGGSMPLSIALAIKEHFGVKE